MRQRLHAPCALTRCYNITYTPFGFRTTDAVGRMTHHHHHPGHEHHPPAVAPLSLLRMSLMQRVAIAAALSALVWLATYWAIG